MVKRTNILKSIGLLISLIALYWLIKTGYYVISYKSSVGLGKSVFGYPKNYWEVLTPFIFWIITLLGGIGIIKTNKFGLIIGLIAIILSIIISLIYTLFISFHRFQYSSKILINGEERAMTLTEKWEIIYYEPVTYIMIFLFTTLVLKLIINKLKIINIDEISS